MKEGGGKGETDHTSRPGIDCKGAAHLKGAWCDGHTARTFFWQRRGDDAEGGLKKKDSE